MPSLLLLSFLRKEPFFGTDMLKPEGYTPKVVTNVTTGGAGLLCEDLRRGRSRSARRALERKLTWIAAVG